MIRWLKRWFGDSRRRVLQAVANAPGLSGIGVMNATGLNAGTVYTLLIAAEERGAVYSEWGSPRRLGGPRTRRYRLTEQGKQELRQLL